MCGSGYSSIVVGLRELKVQLPLNASTNDIMTHPTAPRGSQSMMGDRDASEQEVIDLSTLRSSADTLPAL
jgi:hypothetical protein